MRAGGPHKCGCPVRPNAAHPSRADSGIRAEGHISPSRQFFLRNEVPHVFRNDISRQEIERPARYFALFWRTEHTYPPPFFTVVDFTCTLTKRPGLPTTKSKLLESPHGRLTGNPCSTAGTMNTDSPHSPLAFGSLIILAFRRFTIPAPVFLGLCFCSILGTRGFATRTIYFRTTKLPVTAITTLSKCFGMPL